MRNLMMLYVCMCSNLELVEFQQVTVTAERGQQAALFRASLGACSGGGVGLSRDHPALGNRNQYSR